MRNSGIQKAIALLMIVAVLLTGCSMDGLTDLGSAIGGGGVADEEKSAESDAPVVRPDDEEKPKESSNDESKEKAKENLASLLFGDSVKPGDEQAEPAPSESPEEGLQGVWDDSQEDPVITAPSGSEPASEDVPPVQEEVQDVVSEEPAEEAKEEVELPVLNMFPDKTDVPDATVFYGAWATSELADQAGHNYSASNVLKNDDTCWCEGASGEGVGEQISLYLPEIQRLYGLEIVNGYAGTKKQYENNGKVNKIKVYCGDGSTFTYSLDVYSSEKRSTVQKLKIDYPVDTDYVTIEIVKAEKAKYSDICLSYIAPLSQ